jgi:hypothetical protein
MTQRARYIRDHAPAMLLIQAVRAAPGAKLDLDAAIRLAGALWDRLEAAASDPPRRQAKPRPTPDHYAALPETQRAGFDAFWRAYGHPKGKQRAAARWAQIDPDAALTAAIVAAAERERAQPRAADAVRKYPEGWLSERRWEDHAEALTTPDPAAARAAELRELVNERAVLKRLATTGDPHIAALLADIEARLAAARVAP